MSEVGRGKLAPVREIQSASHADSTAATGNTDPTAVQFFFPPPSSPHPSRQSRCASQEVGSGDRAVTTPPSKAPLRANSRPSRGDSSGTKQTCCSCSVGSRLLCALLFMQSLLIGGLLFKLHERTGALEAAVASLHPVDGTSVALGPVLDLDAADENSQQQPAVARTYSLLLWPDKQTAMADSLSAFVRFVETELAEGSGCGEPSGATPPDSSLAELAVQHPIIIRVLTLESSRSSESESDGHSDAGPLPHDPASGPCLTLFLHFAISNKLTDMFDKTSYMQLQENSTDACPLVFVVLRQLSENSLDPSIEPNDLLSGATNRQLFLEFRHRINTFYPCVEDSWNTAQLQRLRQEWEQQERIGTR